MDDIHKYVTHFEKKDYPVKDFYLIHSTSLNSLDKILKVGKMTDKLIKKYPGYNWIYNID